MIMILYWVCFIIVCAMGNVSRGEKMFGLTSSTEVGRLFMAGIVGGLAGGLSSNLYVVPIIIGGLVLWCSFGWDNYWSAAINNPTDRSKKVFWPVDQVMKHLLWLPPRAWGTLAMCLRGFIGMYPMFIGLGLLGYHQAYVVGLFSALQGFPYLIGGIPKSKVYSIMFAEIVWGTCIGILLTLTLNQG